MGAYGGMRPGGGQCEYDRLPRADQIFDDRHILERFWQYRISTGSVQPFDAELRMRDGKLCLVSLEVDTSVGKRVLEIAQSHRIASAEDSIVQIDDVLLAGAALFLLGGGQQRIPGAGLFQCIFECAGSDPLGNRKGLAGATKGHEQVGKLYVRLELVVKVPRCAEVVDRRDGALRLDEIDGFSECRHSLLAMTGGAQSKSERRIRWPGRPVELGAGLAAFAGTQGLAAAHGLAGVVHGLARLVTVERDPAQAGQHAALYVLILRYRQGCSQRLLGGIGPSGLEVEDRLISVCARKPVAAHAADLESLTQEGDRAGSGMARSSANRSRISGLCAQGPGS